MMKKFITFLVAGATLALTGVALIHCGGGTSSCTKPEDCPKADEYCNLFTHKCEPNTACNHVDNCAGKCCGDDGCPNPQPCYDNCAASGKTCNTSTCVCEDCQPDCGGKQCGDDGCGGSCGICTGTDTCNADGQCVPCQADCTNKDCGDDGCGGSCGSCNAGEHCDANGTCVAGSSKPGQECPNGDSDCPADWPTCVPDGGQGYCSKACTTDADCGAPDDQNCCKDIGGGKNFCVDHTLCPGNADLTDPCPFDNEINNDADGCKTGLDCIGFIHQNPQSCSAGSDCTEIDPALHPDCGADGTCGGSACCEPCPGGDANNCPANTAEITVNSKCYCGPKPSDECTDPVNNVGCPAGEKCVVYQGALVCTTEGPADYQQVCDPNNNNACKAGMACISWNGGEYLCSDYCNGTDGTGCRACDLCQPDQDLPAWGECVPLDCCTMESSGSECTAGNVCIPLDDACTIFSCYPIYGDGVAEGGDCTYSNECNNGLFCGGSPATCNKICNSGVSCTSPQTCQGIDGCDGTPDNWGVCFE